MDSKNSRGQCTLELSVGIILIVTFCFGLANLATWAERALRAAQISRGAR